MKTIIAAASASLMLALSSLAHAGDNCIGLDKAMGQAESKVTTNLWEAIKSVAGVAQADECGSLKTVFGRLAKRQIVGGRKLEKDKPLDTAAAQADLDEALKDAEVRARIDKVRATVTDENARLIYEAAILDDEGHPGARDLLVAQVLERAK